MIEFTGGMNGVNGINVINVIKYDIVEISIFIFSDS